MAATVKKNIWLLKTADGRAPSVETHLIAATQGILVPNAPVYINTDGLIAVCDTSDGSDVLYGFLVGVKNKSTTWPLTAALAASTEVYIQVLRENDQYCMYVESGDADAPMAQTYVGEEYGMTVATGAGKVGYTTLAVDNANATFRVVAAYFNLDSSLKLTSSTDPGIAVVRVVPAVLSGEKA